MRDKETLMKILNFIEALELDKKIVVQEEELSQKFLSFEKQLENINNPNMMNEFREISDLATGLETDIQLFYLNIGLILGELKGCSLING